MVAAVRGPDLTVLSDRAGAVCAAAVYPSRTDDWPPNWLRTNDGNHGRRKTVWPHDRLPWPDGHVCACPFLHDESRFADGLKQACGRCGSERQLCPVSRLQDRDDACRLANGYCMHEVAVRRMQFHSRIQVIDHTLILQRR